ncbi:uncharacterized protein METZ01_LOCUS309405, partial [marine metagenome]
VQGLVPVAVDGLPYQVDVGATQTEDTASGPFLA